MRGVRCIDFVVLQLRMVVGIVVGVLLVGSGFFWSGFLSVSSVVYIIVGRVP